MTYEEEVESLDIFDKLRVYLDYNRTMLGLKHWFIWSNGEPHYCWKSTYVISFEQFINKDNIIVTDMGDEWETRGFAQKIRVDYAGIYDWYWKFKDRVNEHL